jgi:hypothetical protein
MRRLLSQSAHAASHAKGSYFEALYRRLAFKIGPQKATWAVAHRLCRLIWKILHERVQYQEKGDLNLDPIPSDDASQESRASSRGSESRSNSTR